MERDADDQLYRYSSRPDIGGGLEGVTWLCRRQIRLRLVCHRFLQYVRRPVRSRPRKPLGPGGAITQRVSNITKTVLDSGSGSMDWVGRASMEVVGGVAVMIYRKATHHGENDGALHIRFSSDYGETWTNEDKTLADASVTGFPMNPPDCDAGQDSGEPWLYTAPNGNLILHMWRIDYGMKDSGTYQSVSTDGGLTWSTAAAVDLIGIADDTEIFITDDHFVYDGVIYAGARQYVSELGSSKSLFVKSTDNGATWEYVSDISDWVTYPTEEVGFEYIGNNTIIALLRGRNWASTYKSVSTDMGATWSAITDITAQFKTIGRTRIFTLAHLRGEANWWNDPNLICIGHETVSPGSSSPRQNSVWLSFDSGATWPEEHHLDAVSEDAGYGDIVYDPNTGKYVNVTYQGSLATASLVQYKFNVTP
jgi:hypothetical protein